MGDIHIPLAEMILANDAHICPQCFYPLQEQSEMLTSKHISWANAKIHILRSNLIQIIKYLSIQQVFQCLQYTSTLLSI